MCERLVHVHHYHNRGCFIRARRSLREAEERWPARCVSSGEVAFSTFERRVPRGDGAFDALEGRVPWGDGAFDALEGRVSVAREVEAEAVAEAVAEAEAGSGLGRPVSRSPSPV